MDIKIQDKWLREYLETNAKPDDIARCLSLSGPSVDRVEKTDNGTVYDIEVTSNRTDCASIVGIAREASAILPRFGFKASFIKPKVRKLKFVKKVGYLNTIINHNLCPRFTAVLIRNVKIAKSPKEITEKLAASGGRGINNIVDISNYIMYELGQPVHTFDYDKIKDSLMMLRESKKGEACITLDGVKRNLPGGDIVIEDGSGKLIDLCGIMGGELSAVDENTKNVLLFVQSYNPVYVRRTSMSLAHRTDAAILFEKGLDPEGVSEAISKGVQMFEELTGGIAEKEVLDIYPSAVKNNVVKFSREQVENILGIPLKDSDIVDILEPLGFAVKKQNLIFTVSVPSYRNKDIAIVEDIAEEIARIYGYHNIPSTLMPTAIPEEPRNQIFDFEDKIKNILKGYGGYEVYTLSLVSKSEVDGDAYKLLNPLGKDAEYLRLSMLPSLTKATNDNQGIKSPYFLFEISNIYLPRTNDLPEEKGMLSGILVNTAYREAKGIVESLLEELNISYNLVSTEEKDFEAGKLLKVNVGSTNLGKFGITRNQDFYFEFEISKIFAASKSVGTFKQLPKYPSQIEVVTAVLPKNTLIGNLIKEIEGADAQIVGVELKDIFNDSYSFQIEYQNSDKTLLNKDVEKIRNKIINHLVSKYGATIK